MKLNAELAKRQTVGGRIGSGLGSWLEAELGFQVNEVFSDEAVVLGLPESLELAWIVSHGFNDFAVIDNTTGAAVEWTPSNHVGEMFRVEVKSMALDAVESKAHFDALQSEIGQIDQLVVLLWRWVDVPGRAGRVCPRVEAVWVGESAGVAELRDELHLMRGGSFVDAAACPDGCAKDDCKHAGEPLNASGTRERISGPVKTMTGSAQFASNFGGLVRMIKTRSARGVAVISNLCLQDIRKRSYVEFIHLWFPDAETACFPKSVWQQAAQTLGVSGSAQTLEELHDVVRAVPSYRDALWAAGASCK